MIDQQHGPLLAIAIAALVAAAAALGVSLWIARKLERSQPARFADDLRAEMREFGTRFDAFLIALDPDAVTELIARHRQRFAALERVQSTHGKHLEQHDGDIVAVRRDTDGLRVRVARLEEQKG